MHKNKKQYRVEKNYCMKEKEIIALDPHFDFDNAYNHNQNRWLLFNFFIVPEQFLAVNFEVDGKIKTLRYPKNPKKGLFRVLYRQWKYPYRIPLENSHSPETPVFHISEKKAKEWLSRMIHVHHFQKLDRKTALRLAQEKHVADSEMVHS